MLYNFTQDMNNIRSNYESFQDELKKNNVLGTPENKPIGSEYSGEYKGEATEYDSDEYQNQGVGSDGYNKTVKSMEKTTKMFNSDGEAKKGEGLTTDTGIAAAGFALNIGQSFSKVSGSESESWAQAGNQAVQGAKLGMQIGGPWGATIGGVIGGGAGIIDAFGDIAKRNKKEREDNEKQSEALKTKRELQYSMDNQQKDIDQKAALLKNQLNYLDLKY